MSFWESEDPDDSPGKFPSTSGEWDEVVRKRQANRWQARHFTRGLFAICAWLFLLSVAVALGSRTEVTLVLTLGVLSGLIYLLAGLRCPSCGTHLLVRYFPLRVLPKGTPTDSPCGKCGCVSPRPPGQG